MALLALAGFNSTGWSKSAGLVEKHTTQKECDEPDPGNEDWFE